MEIKSDVYGTTNIKGDNLSIGQIHIINDEIISYTQNEFIEHTQLYPAIKTRRKYELTILDKHHTDIANAQYFAKLTYDGHDNRKQNLFIKVNNYLRLMLKWAHKRYWLQKDNNAWIFFAFIVVTTISILGLILSN